MSNDLFWENVYQDEEENSQIEFILSYYFTFLKATGPLAVGTLEATWNEQIELFRDVSFYVTHGISNFLLNSRRFKFINGRIQAVDNNSIKNTVPELNKNNESKNSSLNKMHGIIKNEYPTVDKIVTYNIERNKLLIDTSDNLKENDRIKLQSMALKINSIIIFSNLQEQNEIQICVRPAVEYSMYNINESLRVNGLYSFKCIVNLSHNELDILLFLIRKHLLLLDYKNKDTFDFLILNEKCLPKIDDGLNHFDDFLMNNNNGIFQSEPEYLFSEIKQKFLIIVQKFLFECEIQKKKISTQNNKLQKEILLMASRNEIPNNKLQYQYVNYLIFIQNLMEKQIKSFQDKALKILTFFNEMKLENISNSESNIINKSWKSHLFDVKEELKKMRAVFEKFKFHVMREETLDLKTFSFVTRKEEPPDSLHSQLIEIIKDNLTCTQGNANRNMRLQIFQEYIYGPYIGILNKNKQTDSIHTHNFNQVFSSDFVPKLFFVKPSHNLNVSTVKPNKIGKVKNNIQETNILNDPSAFLFNNLKVTNKSISVNKNVDHEMKLRMSISKLNKYVFGINYRNRFELILSADCRKKLPTLNMTELSEELSEYISVYLLQGKIFMSKEKLRYSDFVSLPICIYFGSQTTNGIFDPFINIKCNFNRTDRLPHDIEVEIIKLKSEKVNTVVSVSNNGSFCDESICSQFTNILQINSSRYPFLNESCESLVSKCTDLPKSILTSSTGAKPKQSVHSKSKKIKHVRIDENLETCCICRDNFRRKPKLYLKCTHFFHKECIQIWHQGNRMCPVCRQSIQYEEFPPL